MATGSVVITLTDHEVMEIEEILLDDDRDAALRFLRDVIKHKIDVQKPSKCGPTNIGE